MWWVDVRSWELTGRKECQESLLSGMNPGWNCLWIDQVIPVSSIFCVLVTQIQVPIPHGYISNLHCWPQLFSWPLPALAAMALVLPVTVASSFVPLLFSYSSLMIKYHHFWKPSPNLRVPLLPWNGFLSGSIPSWTTNTSAQGQSQCVQSGEGSCEGRGQRSPPPSSLQPRLV